MYSAYYFSHIRPVSEQYASELYALEQKFLHQSSQFSPVALKEQKSSSYPMRDNDNQLIKNLFS